MIKIDKNGGIEIDFGEQQLHTRWPLEVRKVMADWLRDRAAYITGPETKELYLSIRELAALLVPESEGT